VHPKSIGAWHTLSANDVHGLGVAAILEVRTAARHLTLT
jgi:hypothetical protein